MKVHVIGGPQAGQVLEVSHGNELSFPLLEPFVEFLPDGSALPEIQVRRYVRHRIHRLQFHGVPLHFSADANLSVFDAFDLLWRGYESHCISKAED